MRLSDARVVAIEPEVLVPKDIGAAEAQRLVAEGAQLVEVLSRAQYDAEHLPGALHIPLARIARDGPGALDRSRPVIVYCWDAECDLSPRAAARLETLGFRDVYDLVTGKVGWLAAALPTERSEPAEPRVADIVDEDVPTCRCDETVGEVLSRLGADRDCIVVNAGNVVLGVLPAERIGRGGDEPVSTTMTEGPSTFRPHVEVLELADYAREHRLKRVLITRADGTLVGMTSPEELLSRAHAVHERVAH